MPLIPWDCILQSLFISKPGTPIGMKVLELVHYKLTRIERVQDVPIEL